MDRPGETVLVIRKRGRRRAGHSTSIRYPAMRSAFGILIAVAVLTGGCTSGRRLEPYTEVVMSPGMRIEGTNPNGTLIITAGDGTLRSYSGDGWQKSIRLIARRERWYGSLGLYDPAASSSPYGRLLAEEGRLHFSSVDEALRWLYVGSLHTKPVFRNDGLVLCYSVAKVPDTGQVAARDVAIWQIYINGKRPTAMPGADDRAITVMGGSIPEASEPYPAPVGYVKVLGREPYDPRNPPKQ